jgi:hypothetical protein
VQSKPNIGQLVFALFTKYEREFNDDKLAAVATQVALQKLLRERKRGDKRKSV